jgi:hypothetical protein
MTETKIAKFKRLFPWVDTKYVNFPWADPEEYNVIPLSKVASDIKAELVAEYITPYNLPWLPGYVLKELVEADQEQDMGIKYERLRVARNKAQNAHLAALANGRIKNKDEIVEPMAESTKEMLRELNEKRKAEKASKKAMVEKADTLTNVKQVAPVDYASNRLGPLLKKTASKKPVFNNLEAQKSLVDKYKWCIAGSFVQDPNRPTGTLASIKCEICGNPRQVALADLFHVKCCIACKKHKKGSNGKKLDIK